MDEDASIQPDLECPLPSNGTGEGSRRKRSRNASQEVPAGAKWTKTVHPRGRQARDPLAQYVRVTANSADQMEDLLRDHIDNCETPAEHTTVEITFPTSAAFMVYTGDYSGGSQPKANLYGTLNRSALSVDAALTACAADMKEGLRKQKSIAKTLVEHVSRADGYRYSFHNNWLSKEDGAHRFSYFCNDSTLNKGRAANEGKGMDGKRKMKPVYDCHGTVHIKFSVTKNTMELHYKHVPMHATYEDRAPLPRKNSKRRKIMEVFEPDKLVRERKRRPKAEKSPRPPKRRATEPLPGAADTLSADGGTDGLAPLLEFLGSADREATGENGDDSMVDGDGGPPPGLPFPADKLDQLKKATRRKYKIPRQGNVRPPSLQVPGMMSGYMSGDLITWGRRERKKDGKDAQASSNAEPLAGIAQAAAEVDTDGLTEIEKLRAKLAEAEQRINRLETEKAATPTTKGAPPGWPPSPAPASYAYPPPQFGNVPYQQQYQYPPPMQNPNQQMPSPSTPNSAPASSLRTVQWDPKLISGGGRRNRAPAVQSSGEQPSVPPKGGHVLQL